MARTVYVHIKPTKCYSSYVNMKESSYVQIIYIQTTLTKNSKPFYCHFTFHNLIPIRLCRCSGVLHQQQQKTNKFHFPTNERVKQKPSIWKKNSVFKIIKCCRSAHISLCSFRRYIPLNKFMLGLYMPRVSHHHHESQDRSFSINLKWKGRISSAECKTAVHLNTRKEYERSKKKIK